MSFVFVRIDADTNKVTSGFNKFGGREQTVLRSGVARSENARDTVALRGGRDKHDGASAAIGFFEGGIPGGVPMDAGFADVQIGSPQLIRSRPPLAARGNRRQCERD